MGYDYLYGQVAQSTIGKILLSYTKTHRSGHISTKLYQWTKMSLLLRRRRWKGVKTLRSKIKNPQSHESDTLVIGALGTISKRRIA